MPGGPSIVILKEAVQLKLENHPDMMVCDALLNQGIFAGSGNIIKKRSTLSDKGPSGNANRQLAGKQAGGIGQRNPQLQPRLSMVEKTI